MVLPANLSDVGSMIALATNVLRAVTPAANVPTAPARPRPQP
jgi:hypothetical protein